MDNTNFDSTTDAPAEDLSDVGSWGDPNGGGSGEFPDSAETEDNPRTVLERTILEIWEDVTSNIEASRASKVDMDFALRVAGRWGGLGLRVADVKRYNELYHEKLLKLRAILTNVISKDPDAFKRTEESGEWSDLVGNRKNYLKLLEDWQLEILDWEQSFDISKPGAIVEIAATKDAGAFFMGEQGIVEHLSTLGFQYTEEDQARMAALIAAATL